MPQNVEGYIVDAESGDRVKFLYYEDIDNPIDPVYDEQVVRGRSEEHIFYSHTGADSYALTIHLVASVDEGDDGNAKKIWNDHLFIKSFAFPSYGIDRKGPVVPPRKAIVTIGNWFSKTGVIKPTSTTLSKVCDGDGYPLFIDMSLTLRVINRIPLDMFDIRQLRSPTV